VWDGTLWLHRTFHDADGYCVSAKTLDTQYETWSLERKSRMRDMEEFRRWAVLCGAMVTYDKHQRIWKSTGPFRIPTDLQHGLALADSTTQVLQLSLLLLQVTQGDDARAVNLLDDLVNGLSGEIEQVAIFAPPRLGVDDGTISSTWNLLHKAIKDFHRVEMHHGTPSRWKRVDPLYLWWAQGGWYLLCRQSDRPERLFNLAIARMKNVSVALREERRKRVPDKFEPDRSFDPIQWLGQGDWLYRGGETCMGSIRFESRAVPSFRDRQWQSDARWQDNEDGTATQTLSYPARADGEWEMARRILSWGECCTVERPASLVKRVRELVKTIAGRYGD
jgi:predicted DNA-binding transcriptional regulator YafY